MATREEWVKRTKESGKGWEYHISNLSPKLQAYVLKQQSQKAIQEAGEAGTAIATQITLDQNLQRAQQEIAREQGVKDYYALTGNARTRADAKLDILEALENFRKKTGKKGKASIIEFTALYNSRQISIESWVTSLITSFDISTLRRWEKRLEEEGGGALGGKYGHRTGSGIIDTQPEVGNFIVKLLTDNPHVSCAVIQAAVVARYSDSTTFRVPQKRATERWVGSWKTDNAELYEALKNPDAWKGKYMVAFGKAAANVERPNQLWEIDSSPADVLLKDGRYNLVGVIDVYTRRAKLLVSRTSKATAVALAVRSAILDWGWVESIKTDNGKDYTSAHFTRVLRVMGIEQHLCKPFHPWEKPHIERFFRSFSHGMFELIPGFAGHNVAEAQDLRAQNAFADRLMKKDEVLVNDRISAEQLQEFCDRWCENVYHHKDHGGLDGHTPLQMVHLWDKPIRKVPEDRVHDLDLLLAEASEGGYRTVTKSGIRIDNHSYIAPELSAYVGQRVLPLHDPRDLGRYMIWAESGGKQHFVCVAECPELLGIDRQEIAKKAKDMQRTRIQDLKRELKKGKKVNTAEVLDAMLSAKKDENATVVAGPWQKEEFSPAFLDAAAEARKSMELRTLEDFSQEELIDLQQKVREREAAKERNIEPDFNSCYERQFWLWEKAINEQPLNGEQLDAMERYRREEPRSWRSLDDLLMERWGDRYLQARKRVAGI
jgi:transposase InsO family protein